MATSSGVKKNIISPTGCVHAADGGWQGAWYTLCNHTNYYRTDGNCHRWPTTDKPVTCKRCLKLMTPDEVVEYRKGDTIDDGVFDFLEELGGVQYNGRTGEYKAKKRIRITISEV